jgi:hypothetical protein
VPDAIQNGAAAGSVQPAASDDFVINNKQLAGGGFVQLDPEKKTFENGALYLAISSPSKSFKQGHFVESIGVFFFETGRAGHVFYLDGRSNKRCSTRSNTFPPNCRELMTRRTLHSTSSLSFLFFEKL